MADHAWARDHAWAADLALDVEFGYLDARSSSPRRQNPKLILNSSDSTMLRIIREELRRCQSFSFSVAFVSANALAILKQDLLDFQGQGRIVTSDYLAFNTPQAFAELLRLQQRGIDVRIHNAEAFHPKGYIFDHGDSLTAVVGSANLTATALLKNHEWNLAVSATRTSDLGQQIDAALNAQVSDSSPISQAWVDAYGAGYTAPVDRPRRPVAGRGDEAPQQPDDTGATEAGWQAVIEAARQGSDQEAGLENPPILLPNRMQRDALQALEDLRASGAERGIIISATGTGKTILSALAVKAARPSRTLFLAHREQILRKTMQEYRRVLGGPISDYGLVAGGRRDFNAKYLFSTIQTFSQAGILSSIPVDTFDYVIIDEVHKAGAPSYLRTLDHLRPAFTLGMTATPERTDGFNLFELFDFNVPYEIRLKDALESDMLVPFHYYGVADVTFDDGTTTTDATSLQQLVSADRVEHVLHAVETYGQAGVVPKGLIFCSRNEEARELAIALDGRTVHGRQIAVRALSGHDDVELRTQAVADLERGDLQYLVTVDIFNEGVDIPTVNQVVMLRQTQSAIIFVQQLGRGLRKSPGKDYLVVIDVIGNYVNNFMIPIALFGNNSLNKESLRRDLIAAEEQGAIAGLSSVSFDRIAEARVLAAISRAKLSNLATLKSAITTLQARVGRVPDLWDFYRFEAADPVLMATACENYPALVEKATKAPCGLSEPATQLLTLLSQELLTAKRPHELRVLEEMVSAPHGAHDVRTILFHNGLTCDERTVQSVMDSLTLARHSVADQQKHPGGCATQEGSALRLNSRLVRVYEGEAGFRHHVDDLIKTGLALIQDRYRLDRPLSPGSQYSRKEALRELNLPRSWASTVYGYKVDPDSKVCPVFVTLHKSDEITASTAYEDALIDRSTMVWFTRNRRTLQSAEVAAIVSNSVDLHVFVKKDDAEGTEFYYLGQAQASRAEQTTMTGGDGKPLSVVRMILTFPETIPATLFDYFHPVGDHQIEGSDTPTG